MADREQRRRERYLISIQSFRSNAVKIISKMQDWCEKTKCTRLVDEILHSIFFLGKVNNPQFKPNDIFNDEDTFAVFKNDYPTPFKSYSSHLPKRGPFSCVLDMIVQLNGQENEDQIKKSLTELFGSLDGKEPKPLASSTICVSQKSHNSTRHYGVSNSGREVRDILIAASCLSTWHEYVAGAVMTYYPGKEKKSDFDGTITLPESVRCQAYNISDGEQKPPCMLCRNLFGLKYHLIQSELNWPYGNCAEVESVSNLLQNENNVINATPTGNRLSARQSVLDALKRRLQTVKFTWVEGDFYNPQ